MIGVCATVNFSFLATLTVVSSRQFLFWKCIASKQQLHHSGQISCAFLPHYSDSVEPECSEQFFDGEKSIAVQGIAYLDDEAGGLPELLSLLGHFLAVFFL